jgi:excisionase family DNA binding protein
MTALTESLSMKPTPEILDIVQLAEYLRVPKSSLYKLVGQGKIPSHKVGRHWRFRKESIDRWLDDNRTGQR